MTDVISISLMALCLWHWAFGTAPLPLLDAMTNRGSSMAAMGFRVVKAVVLSFVTWFCPSLSPSLRN
jgi:hypothetical protein